MDEKKKKTVEDISLKMVYLCGWPGDTGKDSSFKVFKGVTGYLSETVKALEKEELIRLYNKE